MIKRVFVPFFYDVRTDTGPVTLTRMANGDVSPPRRVSIGRREAIKMAKQHLGQAAVFKASGRMSDQLRWLEFECA